MSQATRTLALTLFALLVLVGCNKTENSTGPNTSGGGTTGKYIGVFLSSSESGKLTISTASTGVATGTLVTFSPSTDTSQLSGTFLHDTLALSDTRHTFLGIIAGTALVGIYSGPNGSGGFSSLPATTAQTWVGTYTSQASQQSGNIAFVVSGASVEGLAANASGVAVYFAGTVSSGTGAVVLADIKNSTVSFATGIISDSTAAGNYDNHVDDHGLWEARLIH